MHIAQAISREFLWKRFSRKLNESFPMNRIYLKSIAFGFVLGTILFSIAPLGLGIPIIEILKPVLAPGALITRLFLRNSVGTIPITIALMINGVLFTIPFLTYFLTRKNARNP